MSFRQRIVEKLIILIVTMGIWACVSVKPYQRRYLNDHEMQLTKNSGQQFEGYYQSIREGSVPAESGKANDGCGCK